MEKIKLPLSCTSCGSKEFLMPAKPQSDDVVTCVGCGKTRRYADLQAAVIKATKKLAREAIRNAFRKR